MYFPSIICQTLLLQARAQPSTILDRRLVKRHNRAAVDVLVLWARLPQEDATWEPYETFRERFPAFVDSQP